MRRGFFIQFTSVVVLPLNCVRGSPAAEPEIDIKREIEIPGQVKPIPISLSGFSGEVAQVLRFDLEVQGFKAVEGDTVQYRVSGSNEGNVQGRLADAINKSQL